MDREQLQEIVREKVDDMFMAYYEAENIDDGGIEPLLDFRLDEIIEELTDLIIKANEYKEIT